MKKLLAILCAMVALALCAQATTTVTGTIKTLGTGNITSGAFVRFWLRGCGGNQPRVGGTAVIGPTAGGVFYFDFPANASGNISGSLYSTRDSTGLLGGEIECGGSTLAVWYGMQVFVGGKGGPEVAVHAKNTATLDPSNATLITTNPVVAAPTGDNTYARLDAGNQPFTGNVTPNGNGSLSMGTASNRWKMFGTTLDVSGAGTFLNLQHVLIAEAQAGADLGAKINTALAALPTSGTNAGGEIWITQSGTISTQVLINNMSYVTLRCIGADASIKLTNGIIGNPSEPAIKITGTSAYVNIVGCLIGGNGLTGASGNGHGIAVIGTGPTPADINIINCYISFHKGNGKDGTGASMLAAGVYAYQAIDVRVLNDSSLQANNYGAFFDLNSNNFEVSGTELVGNLNDAVVAKNLVSGWIERNDCENNGSGGASDACVWADGTSNLHIERNHIEGNNKIQVFLGNSLDFVRTATINGNYGGGLGAASGTFITANSGTSAAVYKNRIIAQASCTSCRMVDIGDGSNFTNFDIYDNEYNQANGGTSAWMVVARGTATGANGIQIHGNRCGSNYTTDGTITNCFEIVNPTNGAFVANNTCLVNTGATITTCIRIDAGATNTVVMNNLFTVLGGTLTTQIADNAANGTIYIGSNGTRTQVLPFVEGTAASALAGSDVCYADSTAHALKCSYNNGSFLNVPQVIANGTATMTTAAITAPACGTTVTVAAVGVATTDTITWAFNAAPAGSNAGLVAWPTSGNVNFAYCPGVTETPTAATINWRVVR